MKKPEKKKEIEHWADCTSTGNADDAYDHGLERGEAFGYNDACDDWEKFLPSEDDIIKILDKIGRLKEMPGAMASIAHNYNIKFAKAISKRIRGNNNG